MRRSSGSESEPGPPGGPGRGPPSVADSIPIEGPRKVMFDRMSEVAADYAGTTTVARVDVTDLLALRDRLRESWGEASLTAFVVRAAADLLAGGDGDDGTDEDGYRLLNATVRDGEVETYADVNVGVAVDTDRGLLVPTVYAADDRSVRGLTDEIGRLAAVARAGDLDPADARNGTFTVSNAGTLGAHINTPRINPPQTAVVGICETFTDATVVDGEVAARDLLYLTLTYDHRIVAGATAVGFLNDVAAALEAPTSLLS